MDVLCPRKSFVDFFHFPSGMSPSWDHDFCFMASKNCDGLFSETCMVFVCIFTFSIKDSSHKPEKLPNFED